MKKFCLAVFISAVFILPTLVLAQEPEANPANTKLDDVVVTATRSEEDIQNVPAKVEVISSREIELTTGETLTEQLKKHSSIGVIEYPGAQAGIGMRGFRPEFSGITKHTLVLIDGRPAGATNLSTILTNNVERIEVLKGPASSLYGGEAMGGVVNVITKKSQGPVSGKLELGYGSFDTNFQEAGAGGNAAQRLDFDIFASRYDQRDNYDMGNGDERPYTEYETKSGDLRFGMDITDIWRADVGGDIYQGRDISTPGDIFTGSTQPGNKDLDRWGVDFMLDGMIGSSNNVSFTAYKTRELQENYNRYAYSIWPATSIVDPYRSYDSETNWMGLQLKDTISWGEHKFILGADCQDIDKESRSYNQDGTRRAPWSPDESRKNLAGYLETVWKLMDERLTATLGGRYDRFEVATEVTPYKTNFTPNSESFSTFSPRGGLNYVFENGVRLHTTLGKAFVPPSAGELAGYNETSVGGVAMITRGNAGLDPETSVTFDAGIGYNKPQSGFKCDVTYFVTQVDDKITRYTEGNVTSYVNSLEQEMDGLEYEMSFDIGVFNNWNRSLTFYVNGTKIFNASEEVSAGIDQDVHNVSEHTVNYGVTYEDDHFMAKLHARSQGEMKDTDWNAAGYPEVIYPGFTVVDFVIGYKFLEHHNLKLSVDNVLDHDYYEKKGFPKPGRAFYLSYAFEF
ncbi:MAG: TonB-dependent receptor [Desulfobacteraceae bacterium]|nr:TonB-dependent receptor [Desulfobacteraceae bacterium]